jgi:hypothetical protein
VRRLLAVATACACLAALPVATASAHQGNPNFRSDVHGLAPTTSGVTIQVLNRDDRLLLTNRSAKTILIRGYQKEPYARLFPDGTVQVNHNSPATYLNEDAEGDIPVPAHAKASATPDWQTQSKTGKFAWHDHRFHWMGTGTPPIVTDPSQTTKVNDWTIPIAVDGQAGRIFGTLWWTPQAGGGPPAAAIAALVALILLGGGSALLVRRRRRERGLPVAPPLGRGDGTGKEAW